MWLHEDAADHGYTNDDIQMALFDAYSSVFDILTKQQEHPIMDLFQIHMAEYQAKWKKINPRRDPTNNNIIKAASAFAFSVPILPGNASLAVDFVSDLKSHIGRQYSSLADDCVTMSIGKVLFDLVILRMYLSRPAEMTLIFLSLLKTIKCHASGQITNRHWLPVLVRTIQAPKLRSSLDPTHFFGTSRS